MKRNQTIIKKAIERDKFTCQKCYVHDETLNVHHVKPLYLEGKDELNNLITLCRDCHRFAPDNKRDFEKYMQEECNGTMTFFFNTFNKFKKEHSILFNKALKEFESQKLLIKT